MWDVCASGWGVRSAGLQLCPVTRGHFLCLHQGSLYLSQSWLWGEALGCTGRPGQSAWARQRVS